jgi:hypothetical protein
MGQAGTNEPHIIAWLAYKTERIIFEFLLILLMKQFKRARKLISSSQSTKRRPETILGHQDYKICRYVAGGSAGG